MNHPKIIRIATQHTPKIRITQKVNMTRYDLVNELRKKRDNVGVELGVAEGAFSEKMVLSRRFRKFIGIDTYGDTHDTDEYLGALERVGVLEPYSILRLRFDQALKLFDDNSLDFVYVDGFAHTGEEGGKTIIDWYKKVRIGGVLAGDDYHRDWPLVVWAVNDFASKIGADVNVTCRLSEKPYARYPSWYILKEKDVEVSANPLLVELAARERRRIERIRVSRYRLLFRTLDKISRKFARKD